MGKIQHRYIFYWYWTFFWGFWCWCVCVCVCVLFLYFINTFCMFFQCIRYLWRYYLLLLCSLFQFFKLWYWCYYILFVTNCSNSIYYILFVGVVVPSSFIKRCFLFKLRCCTAEPKESGKNGQGREVFPSGN